MSELEIPQNSLTADKLRINQPRYPIIRTNGHEPYNIIQHNEDGKHPHQLDYEVWVKVLGEDRDRWLEVKKLADILNAFSGSDQLYDSFSKEQAAVYAFKPNLNLYYPCFPKGLNDYDCVNQLRDLLICDPIRSMVEVTIQLSRDEVVEFYRNAPWDEMGENILIEAVDSEDGHGSASEADLFIAYMTSGSTTFGIAYGDEPIIETGRKRLGETSAKEAYDEDMRNGHHSIRGFLGSPFTPVLNRARDFTFLNGVHFSPSIIDSKREAHCLSHYLDNRLMANMLFETL